MKLEITVICEDLGFPVEVDINLCGGPVRFGSPEAQSGPKVISQAGTESYHASSWALGILD